LIPEFKLQSDKGEKYSIEDVTSFPIANAVSDQLKRNQLRYSKLKWISLMVRRYVEKGWDKYEQMQIINRSINSRKNPL
jgi:hypothetical protein